MHDLRHAFRRLAASPGFTVVALVTLALGIGVNTSMFSVLHTLLLRTLPYPDGDQLVRVYRTMPQGHSNPHSPANFLDYREQNTVFAHLTALQLGGFTLAEPDQPAERLRGMRATADIFPLFGIAPALGRVFTTEEDQPGQNQVVVLSHDYWAARFASDPEVIGRQLRLDGSLVTVIGVMPPGFNDPMLFGPIDAWRPMAFSDLQRETRRSNFLTVVGRLKPAVSLAQAETEMNGLAAHLASAWPDVNAQHGIRLAPLSRGSRVDDGSITLFVTSLAALVLLIACANLANLQFARTIARAREHAIRAALGASRSRLMRQVLAESILLALAGGVLGVVFALWLNDALGTRFLVDGLAGLDLALDWRAVGFALVASAGTGLAFGLVPALFASRTDVNDALKQGARGTTAAAAQHRVRQVLIVAQVALALVLLTSAALFLGGLHRFTQRDPGWHVDGLLKGTVSIGNPPSPTTPERRLAHRAAFVEQLEQRLANIPGVENVAIARALPTWGSSTTSGFVLEGQPPPPSGREASAESYSVSPGFFDALGIRVLRGQAFSAYHRADTPPVVIINETMARAFWPGENPVGQRIGTADPANRDWREVIGVVNDVRSANAIGESQVPFQMYRPWAQAPDGYAAIALRTRLAPEALAPELRRAVAEIDPGQPIYHIDSVRREVDQSVANLELAGWTLVGFATLGLLLAALGIYAVIANSVVQRTSEIGIRMALGAQVSDVLALVMRQGFRLALTGMGLGLLGAFGVTRLLESIMPGIPPANGFTIALASGVLLAVAALACWLPARRAVRVDPVIALRTE